MGGAGTEGAGAGAAARVCRCAEEGLALKGANVEL